MAYIQGVPPKTFLTNNLNSTRHSNDANVPTNTIIPSQQKTRHNPRRLPCAICIRAGMVKVVPIRAYRPPPDLAGRVSAPPYDVLSSEEARKMADGDEMCFLRVRA